MPTYHVRITGEDGPHLPAQLRPLPLLSEELTVFANDRQGAYIAAQRTTTLRFAGHHVRTYIDGEEHFDERF